MECDVALDPPAQSVAVAVAHHAVVARHGVLHRLQIYEAFGVLLLNEADPGLHFLQRFPVHLPPVHVDLKADEADAVPDFVDGGLGIEFEMQLLVQELLDPFLAAVQLLLVWHQEHHVVHVADVVVHLQRVLDELIQLVQADVRQQLAREVSDRHPDLEKPLRGRHFVGVLSRWKPEGRVVAVDDRLHKPEKPVLSLELPAQDVHENLVIHAVEVFGDVELQIIPLVWRPVDLLHPALQPISCAGGAFADAAAV